MMDAYEAVAVIDANIVLEGPSVADMPWAELSSGGAVLVLLVPQVLREIDSKKRDGRLQVHARAFNRLFAPAAQSGQAHRIREAAPLVDIMLARCSRIPWEQYDDLDPAEGDHKVIAEALNIIGLEHKRIVFVSSDCYPIGVASRYELRTYRADDAWLRPPEPSPHQKEVQRLKARVAMLETSQPSFAEPELVVYESLPLRLFDVAPVEVAEQELFISSVLSRNPREVLRRDFHSALQDLTYESRYERYASVEVPEFVQALPLLLELLYGQFPFTLQIENTGAIHAENLVIEISTSDGWIHDKFVYEAPAGPMAPKPRNAHEPPMHVPRFPAGTSSWARGRHDVVFDPEPSRDSRMVALCQDFRHGHEWRFDGVLRLDPRSAESVQLQVRITASNMRGEVNATLQLSPAVDRVKVSDLVDLSTGTLLMPLPMTVALEDAKAKEDFNFFERLIED